MFAPVSLRLIGYYPSNSKISFEEDLWVGEQAIIDGDMLDVRNEM